MMVSQQELFEIAVSRLQEFDRYAFYDHLKVYTAAPPDVLRVDEKFLREYTVVNVTGVILTTNHKTWVDPTPSRSKASNWGYARLSSLLGSLTARTEGRFPTGWRTAATSRCTTIAPRTACGRCGNGDRQSMQSASFPSAIRLLRQRS
jgi:hypothetical protein